MKIKLLLGMAAIILVSCNDADTDNVEIASHDLYKITTVSEGSSTDVKEFANNKLIKQSVLEGGETSFYYEFSYGAHGQLSGMTGKDAQGQLIFERALIYDATGKLTAKNDTYYNLLQGTTDVENITYTYNTVNNTVFADYSPDNNTAFEGNTDRTYNFNTNGLLESISVNGNIVQQFQYDGNNITNMANVDFTYDTATEVKGAYLDIYRNQFSSYANFIIYNGYMVPSSVNDKYLLHVDENPGAAGDIDYAYQFDNDGYPVTIQVNPAVSNAQVITITYQ